MKLHGKSLRITRQAKPHARGVKQGGLLSEMSQDEIKQAARAWLDVVNNGVQLVKIPLPTSANQL